MVEVGIETAREKLNSIQLLRALAALAVVADHTLLVIDRWAGAAWMAPLARAMGAGGVYLFFVISGLIMLHTSGREFGQPGGWRRFLTRRLERIVPLYWLVTGTRVAGRVVLGRRLDWPLIASSLLFFPHLNDGKMRPLIGMGWTLNYEMLFYVLFAVALLLPRRIGLAALFGSFGVLAVAGLAINPTLAAAVTPVQFWTAPIILLFVAGVAIGLMRERIAPLLRWNPENWGLLGRLALLLGNASYSIYLWQGLASAIVTKAWMMTVGPQFAPVYFVAMLAGAAALGVASYWFFERPVAAFFRSRRRIAASSALAPA
jgi:peptidoglycan/LPS O-acetylase OafA/YrhL